jgi:hypothetical protein
MRCGSVVSITCLGVDNSEIQGITLCTQKDRLTCDFAGAKVASPSKGDGAATGKDREARQQCRVDGIGLAGRSAVGFGRENVHLLRSSGRSNGWSTHDDNDEWATDPAWQHVRHTSAALRWRRVEGIRALAACGFARR